MEKRKLNVVLLGIVSLINDISSQIILPILPMFISALGGGGFVVGLIGGIRESIASILKVVFGYLSDKFGKRKIFVYSGYLSSAVFKLILAFSKLWQHVLILIGFERVGKALRESPRDAMISDFMPKEKGRGFGINRALDAVGGIIGAITAFVLFWVFDFSFGTIIFIAALIAFFIVIPLYFVKEKKIKPQKISFRISFKELPSSLKLFIIISIVFALGNFSYMFFVLKAQQSFLGKFAIGIPILLYVLYKTFYSIFAVPFGRLSDKIGRRKVLILGYSLFSVTTFGFAFLNGLVPLIVLFVLYGLFFAVVDPNQRAFVADLSPKRLEATAFGTFHTSIGLSALVASLIAGFIWQIDPMFTFVYGAVVSLAALVLLVNAKI